MSDALSAPSQCSYIIIF